MAASPAAPREGFLQRNWRGSPRAGRIASAVVALGVLATLMLMAGPLAATEDAPAGDAQQALLAQGAQVYNTACVACHQAGGVGIEGSFPPLAGNPKIEDAAYVTDVIRNGLQGEIEVNGVVYNGVMQAQPSLTDEQIDAVIAFMQAGFVVPGGAAPAAADPVSSSGLPAAATAAIVIAFFVVGAAVGAVVGPRYAGRIDRFTVAWSDAWLRAALIVIFFVAFVVYVPSYVLGLGIVSGQDRLVQDIVGSGMWLLGLGVGLWALWYAHRDRRI